MTEILRMYRGDDRTFTLTVVFDGVVADLSSVDDIRFTAKRSTSDPDDEATVALELYSGVDFDTDGTDGKITVAIPAGDTAALGSGTVLLWDVEVTGVIASGGPAVIRTWPESADGVPQPGKLVVVGDVSRSVTS